MNKIPLILDCDPGVDDSFALALLAASPQIELLAVTPVEGNVPASRTRRNALGLCQMLGLDCRVAFGAERPLRKAYTRDASAVHGASGVGSLVFPEITRTPDPLPAWEVIYREAVRCGGQLVLLAVGPLTNIATALRLHPDLPRYLKKLCIMGGGTFGNVAASGGRAEFNIWVDPTAAKEVFAQVEVWMVGLDATHASAVTAADFDEMIALCGSGDGALVPRELARFSKQNSLENGCDNHIIHDALAAASVIDPQVVTFERRHVTVEDRDGAPNQGETLVSLPDGTHPANCQMAVGVDRARFTAMLKDMCRYYASAAR